MTQRMEWLIRRVCEGDIRAAQREAGELLAANAVKKDEAFCQHWLDVLDKSRNNSFELPPAMQGLLVVEDTTSFPTNRFILRADEGQIIGKMLSTAKAADKLAELGIACNPTLMLHGISGGGKTMLAKYIAHRLRKPFVYVRFANVMDSKLGATQGNIAKIFDFVRRTACVLCFDEIDAIGLARGQRGEMGEMSRIVIALMQEMDNLSNDTVIIGTTNRHDRLDDALLRRFRLHHEVMRLSEGEVLALAERFLTSAGYDIGGFSEKWCSDVLGELCGFTAAEVVRVCTEWIIADCTREED